MYTPLLIIVCTYTHYKSGNLLLLLYTLVGSFLEFRFKSSANDSLEHIPFTILTMPLLLIVSKSSYLLYTIKPGPEGTTCSVVNAV